MSISTRIAGLRAMLQFDNRWQLIIDRLVFHSSVAVYRYRGCKFLVDYDGGDASGIRQCLATDMYRQFMPHMQLKGPLAILDCGANAGGFPLLFHAEGYALSKVVCVEMNPSTYTRLRYNLHANLAAETICLNAIVEDEAQVRTVRFGAGSTGDSLFHEHASGKRFEIGSRSLDDLINGYFPGTNIDVVKIDIEGAEYMVFAGRNYNLLKKCRYIVMEIHSVAGHDAREVLIALQKLGFDLVLRRSDIFLFTNREHHG